MSVVIIRHVRDQPVAQRYRLRCVATGECIEMSETIHYSREELESIGDGVYSDYIWLEGNYGCDCNRWLFFERGKGHDPDLDEALQGKCGEGAYVFEWVEINGVRIVENDQATEAAT